MEKFDIFNTHTHLNADDFVGRETEELAPAKEMGVARHNVVDFDAPTIKRTIGLVEKPPETHATTGWYPTEAGSYNQEIEDMIVANLLHPKVIGPGEIGLDYHRIEDPKDIQIEVFKRQIRLSRDHNLPSVIHTRDAPEDTYAVIKEAGVGPRGGIIHSFLGSLEMAECFIELGMMISFSGVVTFEEALDVQEAAQGLPFDRILAETDAPYLAPAPKRGRENRTAHTRYVVNKTVELRDLTSEEVVKAILDSAKRLSNYD